MASQKLAIPGDDLLERLNRLALSRSFTPQTDIDWDAETTHDEYAALFAEASLLSGTGFDERLDDAQRAVFCKYQQINLMLFTGLLERHGIAVLAQIYDHDRTAEFTECLGNFLKEEVYHYTMFTRASGQIEATLAGRPRLPRRSMDRVFRLLFGIIGILPGRKLRANLAFTFFRFAEQVTIYIHQLVHSRIPRREGFINQIWAYHAIDEARHLAFDQWMLERNRLWWPVAWVPRMFGAACCLLLALLINANEIWIARQLGVRVRLWHLPWLVRRTKAPFKHRVFGLLGVIWRGDEPREIDAPAPQEAAA